MRDTQTDRTKMDLGKSGLGKRREDEDFVFVQDSCVDTLPISFDITPEMEDPRAYLKFQFIPSSFEEWRHCWLSFDTVIGVVNPYHDSLKARKFFNLSQAIQCFQKLMNSFKKPKQAVLVVLSFDFVWIEKALKNIGHFLEKKKSSLPPHPIVFRECDGCKFPIQADAPSPGERKEGRTVFCGVKHTSKEVDQQCDFLWKNN